MIHSKSQKTKKIVQTDDERLFYTRAKLKEEESNSQINNKEIKDFFQTSPIKKPNLKKDSSYEYKIGNYLIQQTLGQGTFGKVKLGIYLPTQEKVAIKVLEKERMTDKDDKIRVKREFDMLSKFNHPNVILVTEIFESVDSYYSVMEYCEGGELFNYIVEKKRLSENETSFFYFQIINGLEYIHSLGIVHRDLKPENLLLTKEHLLKIIDFGLSNYFVDGQETLLATPCGSPCYASPEMVSGKKYNGIKIDIWATGIILFAMLCGYLPFEDKDNEVLFDKILECKIEFPEFLSDESKDLIKKILVIDPEERIDINGIKKHSFFLKGKRFFDQIFTIKQINVDDTENNSVNNDNDNDNYNENSKDKDIDNDAIEIVDKEEIVSLKDTNENEIEIKINKEKDNELSENKENINSNIKANKDNTKKDIIKSINDENNNLNSNKKGQTDIGKNKDNINKNNNMSKDNFEKKLKKEKNDNLNDNTKHKNSKDYRRSKDFNRHQHMDKKEKIDIADDNKNYNGYNNKKKLSDLIPKNYNKKYIQKTPENKNPKIHKQKETTIDKTQKLDTVSKEQNTYGSIASIGSSLVENLNTITNQTNNTMNNMNYNVNISFNNTKRTYSHENTKEDMIQIEQSKNNTDNTLFQNNFTHNTTSKNSNNINIVDNYLTVDVNKNETNNNNNNNNIYLLNYNNKKYKFSKIRNTNPSKIKKNLKDIRTTKQYLNSDNIKAQKQDLDFNICKFLINNNSHIKKNYKEFLSKRYGGNTVSHKKNNDTKTINTNSNNVLSKNKNSKYDNSYKNNTHNYNSKSNDKKIYNQRTNYLSNYQNTINNKENNINIVNKKNNIKKLQNYKKININNNIISKDKIMNKSKNLSIINNNSKNKSKMLTIKSTQLTSKTRTINKTKRTNKLNNHHFLNQFSMEIEFNSINNNLETDPNLKKRIKSINKLTKKYRTKVNSKVNSNTENKKLSQNINIKYSMNTLRKLPISNYKYSNKENLDSPLKNGKYRQKLTKYHINNPSINSSHKKHFYTINNIVTNFKMYKPDLIATINKTNQKNVSRQVKKPTKDEISNILIEKTTKSIEINKNNRDSFFKAKNEKQNNISGLSSIYNLSNNDTLTNYLKNTDRTPNLYIESNLSKNSKKMRSQKSKNQMLIICSECDLLYEKNKILKMNKYRKLCLKTNEDLKDTNYYKRYHIKRVKKISNINNYKENILRIKKNKTQNNLGNIKHMTFHTSRTHNKNLNIFYLNKKHTKYNSMRISDLYRNNVKNKKKEKKVYLVDNDKNFEEQSKIKTKNKFSVGNKALLPRNIISINNLDNNNDKIIQIKKSENNISNKVVK